MIKKLEDNYLVDNKNASIYNRVYLLRNDTNKISNYLKNTIIFAINSEVSRLYRLIRELEEETAAKTES